MKFVFAVLFSVLSPLLKGAPLSVSDLRTNLQNSPTGVGRTPEMSWKLRATERGKRQTAYQIIAATSLEKLTEKSADLWNSKKQPSIKRTYLPWKGKDLSGLKSVFWKVRVWDEKKEAGPWSEPATFQVDGQPSLPKPTRASDFESSSPALNQLYAMSVEELEKRLQRFAEGDAKALGVGAQVQRSARAMLYHFESVPHLTKWVRFMDAGITGEGTFPILPGSSKVGSVSSEAAITVDHPLWWMSGDTRLPKERWKRYEDHMIFRENNDLSFKGTPWGEAVGSEGMSHEFLDLAYLGLTSRLVRELAGPAEQPYNSIRFKDYAARIRTSFEKHYLRADGSLKSNSQSAQVVALRSAVLTPKQQQIVIANLLASLSKNGVEVGPIGAYFLPSVLTLMGNQDKAVEVLKNLTPEQQEIFAGNGVSEWLMAYLAGIDAGLPGFGQVMIRPRIPTDDSVTWVKARHESPAGTVAIHWQKLPEGSLKVDITIPPGIPISQINLPAHKGATITEGGKAIAEAAAVELVNQSDEQISLVSQSGTYSFLIE